MRKILVCLIVVLLFSSISCTSLMKGLTDSLYEQKDIVLVEEGAPAFLLLVEGLIKGNPQDKNMLQTGIQMFSSYGGAFVKDSERKKIFQDKTKYWALELLKTYPLYVMFDKEKDREKKDKLFQSFLKSLTKSDVPTVFWACNAWIMWIIGNLDSTDAFLELPLAKGIIDRIYVLDGDYYYGAPHLFYGVFYGAFPKDFGGNLEIAKKEFDIALKLSGDKLLITKLFYANFYLKPKNDKAGFEQIINEILETDIDKYPETRLLNMVSKREALDLKNRIDELFFDL